MKSNIQKHRTSFGYPFFSICIFAITIWLLWLTTIHIPKPKRVPIYTKFFFSNIPFKENESYGSPLLFAKPNAKGFSANYNINLKDNSTIEFIPPQSPIFQELESDNLKTTTPYAENIVKKTISPNLIEMHNDNNKKQQNNKQISISKNFERLNFKVDINDSELNKINKNSYANCTVLITPEGNIEHIFFEKTNLEKKQLFILNRAILFSKFDSPQKEEVGHIKFFFKNND